jgi:nucleoside-diphosphate-sugar epimerase
MACGKHGTISREEDNGLKVLVTGASGFLGRYLVRALRDARHTPIACSRSRVEEPGIFYVAAPELAPGADWTAALSGIDAVVHLAGRAQVDSNGSSAEREEDYQRVNAEASRALAKQAARVGVRHFLFMSSVHAVAAESVEVITAQTVPRPSSAYGRSKLAAEQAISEELSGSRCAWTMLRPPLVYGPGNRANFKLLSKLVTTGLPLPLASVRNRRSFIYVENLAHLVAACVGNPQSFGKTFLPSDGVGVSTPELIRAVARASAGVEEGGRGKFGDGSATHHTSLATRYHPDRLFPFPESLLKLVGRLPGLGALGKLTSSLHVDGSPIQQDLAWSPPFTMDEGLRRTLSC